MIFHFHEGSCKVVLVDDTASEDLGGEEASRSAHPVIPIDTMVPDFSDSRRPQEPVGWNCKRHNCGEG